uniref:Uncharacterized protein MANES_18G042000 n=1 Tax=Rhizophora mucronata TaxID=61149 RepID=A0A2P2J0Z7_RHIMU
MFTNSSTLPPMIANPMFGYSILLIPIRLTTAFLMASVWKQSPFCSMLDM